jgi:hypothetical protein
MFAKKTRNYGIAMQGLLSSPMAFPAARVSSVPQAR